MKIRMGFVSNSSSGSFIIHWRYRNFGERISIEEAIKTLYMYSEIPRDLVEKTVQNADGSFTTTFWSIMVNDAGDFGDSAKSFCFYLFADVDDQFQIIDKKIDMD